MCSSSTITIDNAYVKVTCSKTNIRYGGCLMERYQFVVNSFVSLKCGWYRIRSSLAIRRTSVCFDSLSAYSKIYICNEICSILNCVQAMAVDPHPTLLTHFKNMVDNIPVEICPHRPWPSSPPRGYHYEHCRRCNTECTLQFHTFARHGEVLCFTHWKDLGHAPESHRFRRLLDVNATEDPMTSILINSHPGLKFGDFRIYFRDKDIPIFNFACIYTPSYTRRLVQAKRRAAKLASKGKTTEEAATYKWTDQTNPYGYERVTRWMNKTFSAKKAV